MSVRYLEENEHQPGNRLVPTQSATRISPPCREYAAAPVTIGAGRCPRAAARKRQAIARPDQGRKVQERVLRGSACASGGMRKHAGRGVEGADAAPRRLADLSTH